MENQPAGQKYKIEVPFGNVRVTLFRTTRVSTKLLAWTLMWLIVIPVLGYLFLVNLVDPQAWMILLGVVVIAGVLLRIVPALVILARQISGTETLEISNEVIKVETHPLGLRRVREMPADQVSAIRAAGPEIKAFAFLKYNLVSFEVMAAGPIQIIFKGRVLTFGYGLSLAEGGAIVNAIHERLPRYK